MAEPSIEMNIIPQGVGNGYRQGTKVQITGFEFRFVVSAIIQTYTAQAQYSWPGTPGFVGTTRTIPPIKFGANSYEVSCYASGGTPAVALSNQPIVLVQPPPPAPPVLSTLNPAQLCAGIGVPLTGTDLNSIKGPVNDVELQPAQLGVINQQAFPVLPPWTSPAMTMNNGWQGGKLPSFRVMVFWDKYGMDAEYALGTANCSWFDILENSGIYDKPPTVCMYNMKNLSRFEVLYDVTWHPPNDGSEMMIVCPPKELCDHTTVYDIAGSITKPIASGVLYFAIGASDNFQVYPPTTYRNMLTGVFRVFYKDD